MQPVRRSRPSACHAMFWLALITVSLGACGPSMRVRRVSADQVEDVSGKWSSTDAQLVARALSSSCLSEPWLKRYSAQHRRERPVLVVSSVVNNTDEHIDTNVFLKAFEKDLLRSGKVRLVTNRQFRSQLAGEQEYQASGVVDPRTAARIGHQLGASFLVFGNISSIRDRWEGKEVIYYQVDLELHSATSSEVVWIGEKKIKKIRTQASASW